MRQIKGRLLAILVILCVGIVLFTSLQDTFACRGDPPEDRRADRVAIRNPVTGELQSSRWGWIAGVWETLYGYSWGFVLDAIYRIGDGIYGLGELFFADMPTPTGIWWGDYEHGIVVDETDDAMSFYINDENTLTLTDTLMETQVVVRGVTSLWWHEQHIDLVNVAAGGSGATFTILTANNLSGWRLNANTEYLYFNCHVHDDWDGASNLELQIEGELNAAGSAGADTVDFDTLLYYKKPTQTTNKTQTPGGSVVVGAAAQFTEFMATVTVVYNVGGNNIEAGDIVSVRINLDTTDSEVDDVILHHVTFRYKTAIVAPEV